MAIGPLYSCAHLDFVRLCLTIKYILSQLINFLQGYIRKEWKSEGEMPNNLTTFQFTAKMSKYFK